MAGKILLVEDAQLIRQLYQGTLAAAGHQVQTADNGVEALKILTAGFKADLVLLDLNMPVMDGFKVLQVIKSDIRFKHIPVVVFSTRGQPAEVNQATRLGATEYIVKATTKPAEVVQKIAKILESEGTRKTAAHYLLKIDPKELDGPDLQRSLGLAGWVCPTCGQDLILDITPEGDRRSRRFAGAVICPNCQKN